MSRNIRGDRTRTQTLDAAWSLISKSGADISIAEIASAVGVSRQTVYQHFGSRGGLLIALVRRADERFEIREQFQAALQLANPEERLSATLSSWLNFVPKIYPVAKDLIRLRASDAEAAAAWDDRMADLRSWLLALMRSLQRDGALKKEWTPKAASEYFWAQSSVQAWGLLVDECGWSKKKLEQTLNRSIAESLLARR